MGVAGTVPKVQEVAASGLKSGDCKLPKWRVRSAAARGSVVRGLPTGIPQMLASDLEPTPQRHKLPAESRSQVSQRLEWMLKRRSNGCVRAVVNS